MTAKIRKHGVPQVNTKKKLNRWRKSHAMLARMHREDLSKKNERDRMRSESIDRALEGTVNAS